MDKMKNGNTVKINTTSEIPSGQTPGLGQTLAAYEDGWNMNEVNYPTGENPKFDGSGIGKTLKGPGSKP